ncbi:hypothetical protein H0264_14555 [Nocardia huaxiensis]|uniref:Uncharacterized protein n=1 Tax=Nocardia huaxiensis TaxID=2755382 RepID=A0A7D7A0Y3_9NOCA|nr:hypothetical protein [Nocardia huaxiensis]QLY33289.1 hypothetical protein H0264_14555 [Nocardia huaxiensis]
MSGSHRDHHQGIRTTAQSMWFDELPHTAHLGEQGWQVSWLPDRDNLSLEQARDALLMAKLSTSYRIRELARRDWPRIQELARGIGVNPRDAVKLVRDAEAHARNHAVPTVAAQLPHLAIHQDAHPELWDREIRVDARPPTVRTPGRVPGQWLKSGEFLDLERGQDR